MFIQGITSVTLMLMVGFRIALAISPSCAVTINSELISCTISEIHDSDPLLSFSEWKVEHSSLSNMYLNQMYVNTSTNYANVSIYFISGEETEWKLSVYGQDSVETTWMIDTSMLPDFETLQPGILCLHYLPIPENFSHLELMTSSMETDQPCKEKITEEFCSNLSSSYLTLQSNSLHKSIVLSLSILLPINLTVELMHGGCMINCSGGENLCDVDIRQYNWFLERNTVYKFDDLQPAYYCVRVYPTDSDCCIHGTQTIQLLEVFMEETVGYKLLIRKMPGEFIICIGLIIVICLSAVITMKVIHGLNSCLTPYIQLQSLHGNYKDSKNVCPLKYPVHVQEPRPVVVCTEQTQVLLLYSRHSDSFVKRMDRFRIDLQTLSRNLIKVWDPYDEKLEEAVSEDPVAWLESVMNKPDIKFILVEHEEAVCRQQAWFKGLRDKKLTNEVHHLDSIFLYALSTIHNKPHLVHNYCRLFIINFGGEVDKHFRYINIVPCKRYLIPDHYQSLIYELCSKQSTE